MLATRRIVNQAAVREAFHRQGARVPRGFIDQIEQHIYVLLRRAAAGEIEPGTIEAAQEIFLKQSLVKEALREALGKDRITAAWVAHVNAVVVRKVIEAAVRAGARTGGKPERLPVPSRVIRAFLQSPEHKTMPLSAFYQKWQNPTFRDAWTARAGGTAPEAKE